MITCSCIPCTVLNMLQVLMLTESKLANMQIIQACHTQMLSATQDQWSSNIKVYKIHIRYQDTACHLQLVSSIQEYEQIKMFCKQYKTTGPMV